MNLNVLNKDQVVSIFFMFLMLPWRNMVGANAQTSIINQQTKDVTQASICTNKALFFNNPDSKNYQGYHHEGQKRRAYNEFYQKSITAKADQSITLDQYLQAHEYLIGNIAHNTYKGIYNYLKSLLQVIQHASLTDKTEVTCIEGAQLALAKAILDQLENKTRYSVQLFEMQGFAGQGYHQIVVLHAKKLKAHHEFGVASGNNAYNFISGLANNSAEKQVTICDGWLNFYGNPQDWVKKISKNSLYQYGGWQQINIKDFSLPSTLRTQLDWKQRQFFIQLIKNILKDNPLEAQVCSTAPATYCAKPLF